MAIKHFNFSFKLDVKDLLEFITERNAGVEIQAFGTPPKVPKQLAAPKTLALPPPNKREPGKRKGGAMNSILIFLAQHPKENISTAGLSAMLIQQGFSHYTLNNALWTLKSTGFVRSIKGTRGQYRITPKGIRQAVELSNG